MGRLDVHALDMSPTAKKMAGLVAAVLGVLAVAVVALNLWLGSGEATEAFGATDDLGAESAVETGDTPPAQRSGPPAGEWQVDLPDDGDSGVGYRILEDLPVGGPEEIVARTRSVEGTITLDEATLVDIDLTVSLADLESGVELRDDVVAADYLEVATFPTAVLEVAGPTTIELPETSGVLAPFSVPARLTLHGVTQDVAVTGEGQWAEGVIEIVGTSDVTLSVFGVERPNLLGRSARDEATVEFKLRFTPADP